MRKFKELEKLIEETKIEADKFFIHDNMQAGKRYFAMLMDIQRRCKDARIELSTRRAEIRKQRGYGV